MVATAYYYKNKSRTHRLNNEEDDDGRQQQETEEKCQHCVARGGGFAEHTQKDERKGRQTATARVYDKYITNGIFNPPPHIIHTH